MDRLTNLFISIVAALCLASCSNQSPEEAAERYPEDQVSLIVPFATGGASDVVSRAVAMAMEEELGVPVVVVNKTGGVGAIGVYDVMMANADGYRIGYVPVELVMYDGLQIASISPYEFAYISRLMEIPAAITVSADAPYNTLDEFITYAKEHPGELQIGNSGTGSIWHIAAGALAQEAGVKFNYVPFEGAAPAVGSLLGGHIDAVSVSPSEVKTGLDSGGLKVLGVMGNERDPVVPDVPTMKEQGYDVVLGGWGGFVAPKDTPEEIIAALDAAIEKSMETETFQTLAESRGLTPAYLPGQAFEAFAVEQYEFFNELIPSIEME
ncbi:tripartite tricarboxylate transporter substrate binding protein [Bacillus sp. FSL R5-0394]